MALAPSVYTACKTHSSDNHPENGFNAISGGSLYYWLKPSTEVGSTQGLPAVFPPNQSTARLLPARTSWPWLGNSTWWRLPEPQQIRVGELVFVAGRPPPPPPPFWVFEVGGQAPLCLVLIRRGFGSVKRAHLCRPGV